MFCVHVTTTIRAISIAWLCKLLIQNYVIFYLHVLPHPVMLPIVSGLRPSCAIVAGDIFTPCILVVVVMMAISFGLKPSPIPYSGC
jgi:hypothetical protein